MITIYVHAAVVGLFLSGTGFWLAMEIKHAEVDDLASRIGDHEGRVAPIAAGPSSPTEEDR